MCPTGFTPTASPRTPGVPLASLAAALLADPWQAAAALAAELRPPLPARESLGLPASPPGTSDHKAPGLPPPGASTDGDAGLHLVLDRQARLLRVVENGQERRRFSVAVGMPGWETPVGQFQVLEKARNPVWEHPETGRLHPSGTANPLGSRWIGFHRDCSGRKGWDGDQVLDIKGCVVAGFHGTPHRWTVGRAVSHGCVRLFDEDVRELFDMVTIGTRVTVLP